MTILNPLIDHTPAFPDTNDSHIMPHGELEQSMRAVLHVIHIHAIYT